MGSQFSKLPLDCRRVVVHVVAAVDQCVAGGRTDAPLAGMLGKPKEQQCEVFPELALALKRSAE